MAQAGLMTAAAESSASCAAGGGSTCLVLHPMLLA
jgi:hypothetical protein